MGRGKGGRGEGSKAHLVKGSGIREAAVEDLVDGAPGGLHVGAAFVFGDGDDGAFADAGLERSC